MQDYTLDMISIRQVNDGCDWNRSIERRVETLWGRAWCTADTEVATPNTNAKGISWQYWLPKKESTYHHVALYFVQHNNNIHMSKHLLPLWMYCICIYKKCIRNYDALPANSHKVLHDSWLKSFKVLKYNDKWRVIWWNEKRDEALQVNYLSSIIL